jgi:putative DNA primase/helicase
MRFFERNVPRELKDRKQWVAYFKETDPSVSHVGKVMISPVTAHHARSNEPSDWSDFMAAERFAYSMKRMDGLALVLTEGIVFIDIDHSIDDPGQLSPLAQKLLARFPGAYAERSCSGHGVHILVKGKLPEGCMKRNDEIGLEMYDTKRFCCITGDIIAGRSDLIDYTDKVAETAREFLGRRVALSTPKPFFGNPSMADEEIINRAMNSRCGEKFSRLYSGDLKGYPSHSSADLALVSLLAFYTKDPKQIDSIFRTSGLFRDKWDSPRGDTTYGEMTIQMGLGHTARVYDVMQ